MAHEIRNPLSSIKGLAKYFAERTPPGGRAYALAQVMAKEADRLNRVVHGPAGAGAPGAFENGSQLGYWTRMMPSSLPAGQPGCAWPGGCAAVPLHHLRFYAAPQADPDRLNRVLLNLYLDAIQAIGHGGVRTVTASEGSDGRVEVTVADNGTGMTAERLQAIFTPYFTTKADGTVWGWRWYRTLLSSMAEPLRADSRPGEGATSTCHLRLMSNKRNSKDERQKVDVLVVDSGVFGHCTITRGAAARVGISGLTSA
ncbi:ATP-binding protein [Shigella flexneri]